MPFEDDNTQDERAARLLRAARPEPDERFVEATERALLGRARPSRRRRPILAGLGLTGAVAGVALVASLLGAGPLAIDGQQDVRARQDCRDVQVTTVEREGKLVERSDGTTTVVTTSRPVTRLEQRCR
ncbi:hypothetical protein LRS13_19790 [Svornostia abyssi]|uniref:Uncharacterized protein n=1 Tax=Svornostia abyssi TaxID=2898438 RepID=A0ABY5PE04_9ACTN|nr:hypothetical protein LRS13_19790 [Parviterribacteraceae bacterium J379]